MKRRRFPLLLALVLAAALGLVGCQKENPSEADITEGGEIGMGGVVQSLEDGYVTVTLTRDVECNGNFFPEGSDLRFPIDEPIQEVLDLEDIQVGDLVSGCFLSDTVEAGDPPTVWVVSFGLEKWTMTGELLDYSEDFFLVKPLYPDWVVQEAEEVYVSRTGTHYGTDVEDPAVGMYLSFDCARDLIPGDPVQVTAFRWGRVTNPHLVDGEYNTSGTVTRLEQDFITVSLSEDIRYDDYWFPAGTELRSPMDQTIADAIQQEEIQEGDTVDVRYLYGSEALADQEGLPVSVRMVSVHLAD